MQLYNLFILEILFNKTSFEGTLPVEWKLAFVTSIYKSSSRNDIINYRPCRFWIWSLSCWSLVTDKLKAKIFPFIAQRQHGFEHKKNPEINLILRITKLRSFGINGSLLRWFESYLESRVQYVKFKKFSDTIDVLSGVPPRSYSFRNIYQWCLHNFSGCWMFTHCWWF